MGKMISFTWKAIMGITVFAMICIAMLAVACLGESFVSTVGLVSFSSKRVIGMWIALLVVVGQIRFS